MPLYYKSCSAPSEILGLMTGFPELQGDIDFSTLVHLGFERVALKLGMWRRFILGWYVVVLPNHF